MFNATVVLLLFTPANLKRRYDKEYCEANPEIKRAAQLRYSSSPQRRARRRKGVKHG